MCEMILEAHAMPCFQNALSVPRRGAWGGRSMGKTLYGSFSATSKPNFARKYVFESSRRDLHNAHLQKFCNFFATFAKFLLNFYKN